MRDLHFGDLLRRHRQAAGLTQEALGERAGLSLRGLSDLERGARRTPYRDTVLRLADALDLDEVDRAALHEAARRRGPVAAAAPPPMVIASGALPLPLSSFVGRNRELAELRQRLASTRLLTLTGPGGSGKTRLAIQVASEAADAFRDGVVFVPLAATSDPELVASTIAQALGLPDWGGQHLLERLKEHLQGKSVLLVLDNFEQVLAAAPLVSQLLAAASGVKALVTSREPLRLQGEHEYEIPPLALPETNQHPSVEALSLYGAISLFVDRAAAIKPEFGLTDDNAPAIVDICRRVDGLPLAIELAAARIRLMSPQEILARLEHRLTLLTGGPRDLPARQQTLRTTIDWSYGLLNDREQALLRQLSIFVGSYTLEAAEAVVGKDWGGGVVGCVGSLVAKSLMRQQGSPNGETRLGMLETIREYGLEQLEASGELGLLRRRHATFYLALAEEAERRLLSSDQLRWLRRLDLEYDNLRAVMAWSRDGGIDAEIGLRLAGALAWFWVLSGVAWEARGLVEALLAHRTSEPRTRARALHAAARVAIVQGEAASARTFAHESVVLFNAIGDHAGAGRALEARAAAERSSGDYTVARSSLEQSVALAKQCGDHQGLSFALGALGAVMQCEGDYLAARRLCEESAAMARAIGDRHSLGTALAGLAQLARLRGDFEEAAALFHEALLLGTELGGSWRVLPRALGGLAGLASAEGDYVRAARLFGAAYSLWDASGKREMPDWQAVFETDAATARGAMGDGPFSDAVAEGCAMGLEHVVAYALADSGAATEAKGARQTA